MSYYTANSGRNMDMRDSAVHRNSLRSRGRGVAQPDTFAGVGHDNDAMVGGGKSSSLSPRLSLRQVAERNNSNQTVGTTTHTLPRTTSHNHMQNTETSYQAPITKISSGSRINDGHKIFADNNKTTNKNTYSSARATGRINEGHGIFTFDSRAPAKPDVVPARARDLQERPNHHAVRSPWTGYSDIQSKDYKQGNEC
eukprot:PhM_4_TR11262/c0_g1_i1/m.12226